MAQGTKLTALEKINWKHYKKKNKLKECQSTFIPDFITHSLMNSHNILGNTKDASLNSQC